MTNQTGTIHALDRAMQLIDLLFRNAQEMGISEIAKAMQEHKSTIHRTLLTLAKHGYVIQNTENEKYGLGPKLYVIGLAANNGQFSPVKAIQPFADKLFNEFQEVVNVAILDTYANERFRFLTIYRAEAKNRILRLNPLVSSNCECHCASIGKALLAFRPDFEHILQEMPLQKYTKNTLVTIKALRENLMQVKVQGYALDAEELEIGLTCVGVPILNAQGEAILAISISGPTARMHDQIEYMVERLQEAANDIAKILR